MNDSKTGNFKRKFFHSLIYLPLVFLLFLVSWGESVTYSDHDHFLAPAESDLQGWYVDHHPPVWSYLFCGGVTRIADPQSFGLSPFFIFNLVFGTVLGIALFKAVSYGVGYLGARRIVDHLAPELESDEKIILATLFISSGHLVFQFIHGHLTYTLMCWILYLISLWFGTLKGNFSTKQLFKVVVITGSIFLGGFYHSSVYLAAPFGLFASMMFVMFSKDEAFRESRILKFLTAIGLGVSLASFRLYEVLMYQKKFPRSYAQEDRNPHHFFGFLKSFINPRAGNGPDQFELFNFSLIVLLFFVVFYFTRKRKPPTTGGFKRYSCALGVVLIIFGTIMAMGSFANWAPFEFVRWASQDSIRGAARFSILVHLGFFLLLLNRITSFIEKRKTILWGFYVVNIGVLIFWFTEAQFARSFERFALKIDHTENNTKVAWLLDPHYTQPMDAMYEMISQGRAVINCYNSIVFPRRNFFIDKAQVNFAFPSGMFFGEKPFLLRKNGSAVDPACLKDSYFTNSEIFISPACGTDVCTFMNDINPEDSRWDNAGKETGLICLRDFEK